MNPKLYLEISRLQRGTQLLIPKLSFQRVAREIMQQYGDIRWQSLALEALQEAAEIYLVVLFMDARSCTSHRDRVTTNPRDINLVKTLQRID